MDPFPTREEHTRDWENLAREIAASKQHLPENAAAAGDAPKGTLIVIGSGIQGVSFIMGAEAYLRMADKVFYCVSNPPTQVWLHTLRPDAYDLYVLYDDSKPRYHTYVQMSEAILHYVRKGMRVVTVFYGHPGVFVFSTHRAIEIARREGHYAVMKPGISALDCLCADLGVDPAFPGMQTFEATEALVRKRPLDTSTHVVLWQVGFIGDTGYRRKGFINDKFPLLVEYLLQFYGPDHEITHYIAARHPTFEPTIAVHKIGRLLDPRVRSTFTAISTFYIPPKDAMPTDVSMAVRLGLIKPGQTPVDPPPLRQMALYATRELAAVEEFGSFRVPDEYQFQERTRAAEFLIEVGQNIALQDVYRDDPTRAVSEESFPGLSDLERYLLAQRQEDRAQMAAKGSLVRVSPGERLVIDLHQRWSLASGLRAALAADYRRTDAAAALDCWISSQGYQATLARLPVANKLVNASMLLPWTGVYSTPDGSLVLTVIGSPDFNNSSLVYVNRAPITGFTFNNATLTWLAEDGNPHSGELAFHMPKANGSSAFVRTISGKYWEAGTAEPEEENVVAGEVAPAGTPLSIWTGRYETRVTRDGSTWEEGPHIEVSTPRPDQEPNVSRLVIDGKPVDGASKFENRTMRWGENWITFSHDSQVEGKNVLSGRLDGLDLTGASVAGGDAPFVGTYRAYFWADSHWNPCGEFDYDGSTVRLGAKTFDAAVFDHNRLQWPGPDGERGSGRVQFFIDPTTQLPKFIGHLWSGERRPEHPNLLGVWSLEPAAELQLPRPIGDSGVPPRVWETLAAISLAPGDPSRHLLWSRWQRARFTCRLLNNLVPRVCDLVVERAPRPQTRKGEKHS